MKYYFGYRGGDTSLDVIISKSQFLEMSPAGGPCWGSPGSMRILDASQGMCRDQERGRGELRGKEGA